MHLPIDQHNFVSSTFSGKNISIIWEIFPCSMLPLTMRRNIYNFCNKWKAFVYFKKSCEHSRIMQKYSSGKKLWIYSSWKEKKSHPWDGTKTIRIVAPSTINPHRRLSMGEIVRAIMEGTIFHLSFLVKFQSISFWCRSWILPIFGSTKEDFMTI